jgi:hypothetical protein
MILRFVLTAFLLTALAPTEAAAQRHDRRAGKDIVVAESRFGHGTVSGPVRLTRTGREVRLPGGTWIPCGRSCSETLRVESVDFWENRGAGPSNRIDNECGILGCLGRSYRF